MHKASQLVDSFFFAPKEKDMIQDDAILHKLQVAKIAREQFFHVELLYVAQHTQNTTTITLALGNMMNHGSCRRTMVAIVPHPRLRGVTHVSNMLCNNTM
jgi:hypothetical protein